MIDNKLYECFYSDRKHDGTMTFYNWIREDLKPEMTLLNLGAGPATKSPMRSFRGEIRRVIGADIDPAVLRNSELDEAYVIVDETLPLEDGAIDIVLSDYVLEHVRDPAQFLREVYRVMRPGGHFFFRTPNMYHYTSMIARFTPHWFHELIANRVRGLSEGSHEPYPTFYHLNTKWAIENMAKNVGFDCIQFIMFEGQPSYLIFAAIPFLVGVGYERIVNRFESLSWMRSNIFGKLTKIG